MNISQWPLSRIMQLPDCCFGRRWPVIFSGYETAGASSYLISRTGLPDMCVLWEVWTSAIFVWSDNLGFPVGRTTYGLRLGDQLPVGLAQWREFEPLFPESEEADYILRPHFVLRNIRKPFHAQGRRVVLHLNRNDIEQTSWNVGLIFSSIPTEVPDWLISGIARDP